MYLGFKPTKNLSFRLYFDLIGILKSSTNRDYMGFYTLPETLTLSKDGSAFTATTNSPVQIASGRGYIDLTQDEMNADVILVSLYNNVNINNDAAQGAANCIEIYTTTTGESGLTAREIWEYAQRSLTTDVSVNTGAPLTYITDCVRSNPYRLAFAVPSGSLPDNAVISKDGGDFVKSGNKLINIKDIGGSIGTSFWFLDLTRKEMDANTVSVLIRDSESNVLYVVVLKPGELIRNRFVPSQR